MTRSKNYQADAMPIDPVGAHGTDTTVSTATTLTPTAGADRLILQALDQNVRLTLDGTAPTASLGFRLLADDPPLTILIGVGMVVRVIEETAGASIAYQWGV